MLGDSLTLRISMPRTATSHHSQFTTANSLGLPAVLSRAPVFILFNHTQDLCPAAAPHTSATTDIHRNRCNSLLSRQNSIKSNTYTQNITCSLSAVTGRNTVNGRCTSISPRKAKEDWAQTYSTPESLTSISSICLLQTDMSTTQKLT